MWTFLQGLLDNSTFSPHGLCLLWQPELIWLHVLSDGIIAIAYFSIPFALTYFVSKRPDVEFGWVFWAFAIFIMACGMTHVFSILTLWVPIYELEGVVKALTAFASILTAVMLWPLLPKMLAIPSPSQLRLAYAALESETAQRREAEAMFRQSQRMDAVGQLTGGVAHDFNNLLTVIIGNLEIAKKQLNTEAEAARERVTRLVENAMAGAKRAANLTHRLLAFARRQPLRPESTNVNELLTGISEFCRRTLGENIQLQFIAGPTLWAVEVDRTQMEASVLNLVVNARDATPNDGTLVIETANAFIDQKYPRPADVPSGPYVRISVTDSGSGMNPEVLAQACEPFFTTKDAGHGTGLGLSQVYGFVKQSGGHLEIASELGVGTAVRIYLPRFADQTTNNCSDLDRPIVGGRSAEVILVVEDDDDVRGYVVETLRDLNYRVMEASSGPAALHLLAQNHPDISLMLTDVILPGMNGRQLAEEISKRLPGIKVLFMTGYSRDAIVHQGRLDAGVQLIQKPLTQAALAARIRELLDSGP